MVSPSSPQIDKTTDAPTSSDRRALLKKATGLVGWTAFGLWAAGFAAATLRFFFPRVRYEAPTTFRAGQPDDYVVGTVDARWQKTYGIFVVRKSEGLYVLKATCTHLGCNIDWFDGEQQFKCPCHGSFFDVKGDVIGGPAPEPLRRATVSLDRHGNLVVDVA